jgi:hypothetical protein
LFKNFFYGRGYGVEDILKVAAAQPEFQMITLESGNGFGVPEQFGPSHITALTQIFVSCSKSLEILELRSLLFLLPYFQIPRLPHLTTLKLGMEHKTWLYKQPHQIFFPHNTDLSVLFPQLNTVHLMDLNEDEREDWERFFGDSGGILRTPSGCSSVRNLILQHLDGIIAADWLRNLKETFPNVKYLTIQNNGYGDGVITTLSHVFQIFPGLEGCQFNIRLGQFTNLDSVLTGIPESVCQRLRSSSTNSSSEDLTEDLGQLKTSAALTDMTGIYKF